MDLELVDGSHLGLSFGVVNCLVMFPTHFNPNNSLLLILQISLLSTCTPALIVLNVKHGNQVIKTSYAFESFSSQRKALNLQNIFTKYLQI